MEHFSKFSVGPRHLQFRSFIASSLFGAFILLAGLVFIAGCSQEPSDQNIKKELELVSESEKAKLEKDSKELLSAPEAAVKTTKVLEIDKLDTYGIAEATLGTLKGDIDKAKSAGIKQILVVEGTRVDGEKMYVIWKKDASGKLSP